MSVPSIRSTLTRRLLLGGSALVVGTCVVIWLAMSTALVRQFDATLIAKSEALVTASEIDEDGFEIDLVIQEFADFGVHGSDYFEMRHRDGSIIARSPSAGRLAFPVGASASDGPTISDGALADGRSVRSLRRTFTPKDDVDGAYADSVLSVFTPRASLDRDLTLLAGVLVVVGPLSLAAMAWMVRRSLRIGLEPLATLNAGLAAWNPDAEWTVEPSTLPDELRPLAGALRDGLNRVAASVERERQFGAHAAHELRTPIAEVRALAETIARWPDDDPAHHAAEIVAAADRSARLLAQLLELARAEDHGAGHVPDGAVLDEDVALRVLGDVLAAHAPCAAARSIVVLREVGGVPPVRSAALVRSVLDNLVGNAVAYAPEGSVVTVVVGFDRIVVCNPAPDLAPADVARLFDRFWRPAGRGDDGTHAGLGLSIVRACARQMGATARAELSAGILEVCVVWDAPCGSIPASE